MNKVTCDGNAITPSKIVCIGRNYVDHIAELANEVPDNMVVFNKPNSAISTDLHAFHQEAIHYEGELCFLIKNGQFSAVGFGLDLTKRTLQSQLKTKGLPWERAKAFNGSALFSEFVSINREDIGNALRLELIINDEVIQSGGVELMIYKPDEMLADLNDFITLIDGDIVMTGTPKGVGVINQGDTFIGRILLNDSVIVEHTWLAK